MSKHFYTWFTCCLFALLTALPMSVNADDITVNDGTTTNSYVPAYAFYGDYGTRSQFVVPASDLEDMAGGTISAMKFYANTSSQNLTGTWEVYLKEVTETAASSNFISRDGATVVYTGSVTVANSEWNITFASPFSYQGGNLMIEFLEIAVGNAPSFSWYGTSGASVYKNGTSSDHTTFQTAASGTIASFVPKVTFTYTPVALSCGRPGIITLGDVANTTASFSWTASADNETSWTLLVKNGDEVLVNNETVNMPSYTLTGLTTATVYSLSVEVTHVCDGGESTTRIGTLNFATSCDAITTFPVVYGFETSEGFTAASNPTTNTLPTCWVNEVILSAGSNSTRLWSANTTYYHTGSASLCLPDKGSSTSVCKTLLGFPAMVIPEANAYEVVFWIYRNGTGTNGEGARFYISNSATFDASTATEIGLAARHHKVSSDLMPAETATGWYEYRFPISLSGTVYIWMVGESYYGSATYFDDIRIRQIPTCWPPLSVYAKETTTTSALIAWNDTAAVADYQVLVKNGETVLANELVEGDTTLLINGLTQATAYWNLDVTITKVCSETDSSEPFTGKLSFNTDCEAIANFPNDTLHCDFEEYTSGLKLHTLPCWDTICPNGAVSGWTTSSTYKHNGNMAIYASAATGKATVLVSPQIILPEDYEISAFVREASSHSNADSVEFYINTLPSLEGATLLGVAKSLSTDWLEFRKKLAGFRDEIYILVAAYGPNSIYVDDITLRPAPSCVPVSSARLDSVGSHAIKIAWAAGGEETKWKLDFATTSGDFGESEIEIEGVPEYLIEGFEENWVDTVDVAITAVCGEGNESDEIFEASFAFVTPKEPTELPYATGFEVEDDNAKWSFANASTNEWVIGAAGHHGEGSTKGLYISKDEGTTYQYNKGTAQFSWVYRSFIFDDADAEYKIAFDWRGAGESSYDGMIVMLVPDNVIPKSANTNSSTVGTMSISRSTTVAEAAGNGYILFENELKNSIFFYLSKEWQSANLNVALEEAGTYKLCFGWMNDSSTGADSLSAVVDNLSITKRLCNNVSSDIYIHSVGPDSIVLRWAPTHETYSVKVMNVLATDSMVELASNASLADTLFTIPNLTPSTEYEIYLELAGICGEGITSDTLKVGGYVTTECVAAHAPYSMGFEDMDYGSGTLPVCWSYVEGGNSYPYISNSTTNAYEGARSLYFSGGSSTTVRTVALPEIADPLSNLRIRFQYKATSSTYAGDTYPSFIVGVMTNPEDATTFLALDTLDKVSTYTAYEKMLNTVGDAYHYIAIKYAGGTYSGYAVIDNVVVDEIPSCLGATDLVVLENEATLNSVSFGWTSDAASFKVLYKLADEATFTEAVVNEPKITISGLQSSKLYNYEMKVVAVCSATDEAIDTLMATLNAATLCETVTTFPWSENFDDLASGDFNLPCWINEHIAGTSTYVFKVITSAVGGNTTNTLQYPDMPSGNSARLILPEMNIPEANAYEFAINVYRYASSSWGDSTYYDEGLFVMNGSDTLAFIPRIPASTSGINVPVEDEDGWYTYSFALANAGVQQISLVGRSLSGWSTTVDNLRVREIPTCFPAKNLHAIDSLSTTSSVSFGWSRNSDETSWRVVVKNGETELKNEVVSDTVYTITGLTSSTAYSLHVEVYVKCGDIEAEALEGNLSVMTLCDVISTLPWSESFEGMPTGSSSSEAPLCWNLLNANNGTYPYIYVSTNSTYVRTGSKCLFFSNNSSNATYGYAILPEFADLSNAMITFSYKDESETNSGTLEVGYLTNIADESTFVSLQSFAKSGTWVDEATAYLNTVPAGARVAFRYGPAASSYYYLGIDDIVIKPLPACYKPTEVEIVEVTPTSASFNWVGNADNYSVEIFNGTTRLDSTVVSANALPLVIDTLQPNTSYALRFNVFGLCGGEDGNSEAKSTILSVKTPCNLLPASELPYAENFESAVAGSGNLPDCWTNPLGGDYPYVYNSSSSSHAGSKCLYLYGGSSTTRRFAVLPGMEAQLSSLQLAFWYKQGSITDDYGYLTVGVMSDPSDTSTFVAVQSLEKVSTYTQAEIVLSAPANYHYIAFCIEGGNYSTSMYVDDINVSLAPNCKKVKNIEKASVTAYEAVFTWESNGDEEAWNVIVTDLANENAELVNATVNSRTVSVNNLTANTAYNFRVSVAANCGENEVSEVVSKDFSFRTALSPDMTEAIAPENTFTPNLGDASEQAKWIILGESETNHFIFGALEETPAMYISNNNSAWEYTLNAASGSMIYRQFSVADDSTEVRVQFDWQAYGEYTSYYYDYGRALIVAESAALSVSGSTLKIGERTIGTSDPQINGVYCLDDDEYALANVSVWTPLDKTIKLGNAGTYRLLFTWRNDTSSGTQHPLGVKNVSIENLGASIIPSDLINADNDAIQVEKFIRDGQVYIVRDGKIYSIIGTVVR